MKPIKTILSPPEIERLASRSNFRYGKEIAEDGKITIEKENTFNVRAQVEYKSSEKRTVDLMSTTKGLRWKCTCTNRKDMFCQHCVALGIKISE